MYLLSETSVTAEQSNIEMEAFQGYFPIMPEFVNNKQTFMLKVKGESMINAGIFDGDFILVEETPTASENRYYCGIIRRLCYCKEIL